MKVRSQRLKVVLDLSDRALSQSAEQLAKAMQQLANEQQRLDELQGYFEEYQSQARHKSGVGISVSHLMNFNYFLNSLRQAIEQQKQTIVHLNRQCDKAKQHWLSLKPNKKASQLQEKAFKDEENQREKKLQSAFDDNYLRFKTR